MTAYLLILVACLPLLVGRADYINPAIVLITVVGMASLVAAGLLGMAAGRLLPSPVTAPAVAAVGLLFTLLPVTAGDLDGTLAVAAQALPPNLLELSSDFEIMSGRVSAAQLTWMAALAVTGWLLLIAATPTWRVRATLPAALGLAVAVPLLPPQQGDYSAIHVFDRGSAAHTCTTDAPKVCVTRAHTANLPEMTAVARAALRRLSVLPNPPGTAMERPSLSAVPASSKPDPAVVAFGFHLDDDGAAQPSFSFLSNDDRTSQQQAIEREIVARGVVPGCGQPVGPNDEIRNTAAGLAAGYWLTAHPAPAPTAVNDWYTGPIRKAYAALSALPRNQALARVAALRQASLRCEPDLLPFLTTAAKR